MNVLIEQLEAHGPVITDGAWGTQFLAAGLAAGECPDVLNLTHPEQVEAVARAYVEAGSQVILTNTFRANRVALARHGLAQRVREVNVRGVEISRRAAGGDAHVFASLGPSGKLLITGEVSEDELRAAYAEQAQALAEAGAEALVFETMSDLGEAKIGLAAARSTALPVIVSLAFDSGRQLDRTLMGIKPEVAAAELTAAGADALGANCGQGIEGYRALCHRMRQSSPLPLWMKPNAGRPELIEGRARYTTTPQAFAAHAPAVLAAGASFLGGCCGTNPEFIRALRKVTSDPRRRDE